MLVLLSVVSGAGKDTIKKELIKRMDNLEKSLDIIQTIIKDEYNLKSENAEF